MTERERCKNFLIKNGWECTETGENQFGKYDSYSKLDLIGVDIDDAYLVFIGEDGDFLSVPINYFALVGVLLEYRQISAAYISTRTDL